MYREGSTVFGGVELGKRTQTPATFFCLGVKVRHPSFGILCRNYELDRPLTGFQAKIGYLPHPTGTVCYVNLRARFLFRHEGLPVRPDW
jgi:hypothetical protein